MPTPEIIPNDEIVVLSEFTVSTASERGYAASETLSGARVATPIKDLPFTVNIMTSQFLNDFGIYDIGDNVTGYISGFTSIDQGGGTTLRGATSSYQLRDGFFRLGRYGSSNVDRIEVIKGPNAAIYGQAAPGGMINVISKKPRAKKSQRVTARFGSGGQHVGSFEATGSLDKEGRTSYITSAQYLERTAYPQPYNAMHGKEFFLAVNHEFKDSSSLLFQYEYYWRTQHGQGTTAPYIVDSLTGRYLGFSKDWNNVAQIGPMTHVDRGSNIFSATYQKRINSVLSTRVGLNYFQARAWNVYNSITGTTVRINDAGEQVLARGSQPNWTQIREDGGSVQVDLLAHYWLNNHTIENRDLLTIDINDYSRRDPQWRAAGDALARWNDVNLFNKNITLGQPIQYYTEPVSYDPALSTKFRENRNRDRIYGTVYRHQIGLFESRLLGYAGVRYDYVSYNLSSLTATAARSRAKYNVRITSPNAGVNYKVTKDLSAFVSVSKGFNANTQGATAANAFDASGNVSAPKAERSKGIDYGFKASFLESRLNFTLGAFYTTKENVLVDYLDLDSGLVVKIPEGDQLFRGVELDLNYEVNSQLQLGATYSHTDAEITNLGYRHMSVGRSPTGATPDTASVVARYSFTGALKGFFVNAGVRYMSASPTEGPDSGDVYNTTATLATANGIFEADGVTPLVDGRFISSTNQWSMTSPSSVVVDLGLHYSISSNYYTKVTHLFALNVSNALDRSYVTKSKTLAEGRAFTFSYTARH